MPHNQEYNQESFKATTGGIPKLGGMRTMATCQLDSVAPHSVWTLE